MSGLDYQSCQHMETTVEVVARVNEARALDSPGGAAITDCEAERIADIARGSAREATGLYLADRRKQQIDRRGVGAGMNDRLRLEVEAFLEGRDRAGHRNADPRMRVRLGKRKRLDSYQKAEAPTFGHGHATVSEPKRTIK